MFKKDTNKEVATLGLIDIEWLLKSVRLHTNLHGNDLEQAVSTITKLQEIQKEKRKGLNEIYRR